MNKGGGMMSKITNMLALLALAGVMTLTLALRAGADEAGLKHLDEARLAVEKSSLTKESKLGILTNADKAVTAGIPAEDVAVIVTRGLKQGVPGSHIEGFLETATQVKEQNLPVRIVLDRIEQGLAKGVPAERIAGVTQKLSGNLATARPMVEKIESRGVKSMPDGRSNDAIETVARALEKSIPPDAIMSTGDKVRDQKGSIALFNRAVDTMTTFAGNGMRADQASRLVHSAIDRGYSERELETMERYMASELRNGRHMNEVVSGMESRMDRGDMREWHDRSGGGMMGGPGSGGMGGGGSGMMGGSGGMMK
ncbi:MAG: hypothetical protein ACM3MD_05430 [Betaproteobacteria bacterium]